MELKLRMLIKFDCWLMENQYFSHAWADCYDFQSVTLIISISIQITKAIRTWWHSIIVYYVFSSLSKWFIIISMMSVKRGILYITRLVSAFESNASFYCWQLKSNMKILVKLKNAVVFSIQFYSRRFYWHSNKTRVYGRHNLNVSIQFDFDRIGIPKVQVKFGRNSLFSCVDFCFIELIFFFLPFFVGSECLRPIGNKDREQQRTIPSPTQNNGRQLSLVCVRDMTFAFRDF